MEYYSAIKKNKVQMQHGWALETVRQGGKPDATGRHTTVPFYEMSKIDKLMTERGALSSRGGGRDDGEWWLMVQTSWSGENV